MALRTIIHRVVVCLGVLVLAACNNATVAANNTNYTSSDHLYQLMYPKGWQVQPLSLAATHDGGRFTDPTTNATLALLALNDQISTSQYQGQAASVPHHLGATDVQVQHTSVTETIGPATWTEIDGTLTWRGTKMTFAELVTTHDGATFLAYVLAPTAAAQDDTTQAFLPTLLSLHFLK
jgi:hypothetical protein